MNRRDLVTWAGGSLAATTIPALASQPASSPAQITNWLNIRNFGATGDGKSIDSPAINRAIEAAASAGGGTIYFPAGTYASYSIRLKSHITLYLDQGATLLAAPTPHDGLPTGGYDPAEPQGAWEPYQDYGHNHWHNSLIWGESIHDVAILGPGLIWGKGLSRGWDNEAALPDSNKPGVGNKSIALKNCFNVTLRDFAILQGGWFGLLATGVDNLTVDNLRIDTNRDGMDFDCCRNVRVSNCTVNSPWDDAICPKSSYALGYGRPTENMTITNCYVTGGYQLGSVLDGTWKLHAPGEKAYRTGRIKCGTESNGGFKNITVSNCVFDRCHGFELVSEDGAVCEDITVTNLTMRNVVNAPIFLRLGSRMRGPKDTPVGSIKRMLFSNISSSGGTPALISGIPGSLIEDLKFSDIFFQQSGGGTPESAALQPPENESKYPDPEMFGQLPASGFFMRHIRNVEMSNIEIATDSPDARPAFWLYDVQGADFFRVRTPHASESSPSTSSPAPAFALKEVANFRHFGSQFIPDYTNPKIDRHQF